MGVGLENEGEGPDNVHVPGPDTVVLGSALFSLIL